MARATITERIYSFLGWILLAWYLGWGVNVYLHMGPGGIVAWALVTIVPALLVGAVYLAVWLVFYRRRVQRSLRRRGE